MSSLGASGSTGTEGRRGWRKRERGGTETEEGWELGQKGGFKPEFSPWRHTGSPEIRGVINLSVEPANPIAPWPGNLASSGGGRAEASKGTLTGGTERRKRERDEGGKYALLRVICP